MPRLTDPTFKYRNAASTDVMDTLKRHGFKPTTKAERAARQKDGKRRKAIVVPMVRKAA